jgi:hypothetical protein
MIGSILIEAWGLYSIAFVLMCAKQPFNTDPLCCSASLRGLPARRRDGIDVPFYDCRPDQPARGCYCANRSKQRY